MKLRQLVRKILQMMTGKSSVETQETNSDYDNMTAYLEHYSMLPPTYEATKLTDEEKVAALRAVTFYKNLSSQEIDRMIAEQEKIEQAQRKRINLVNGIISFSIAVIISSIILLTLF